VGEEGMMGFAIPLVDHGQGLFSLAGRPGHPPSRLIWMKPSRKIAFARLHRSFVDSLGRKHRVYMLAGFADTLSEAYPWLAGEEE